MAEIDDYLEYLVGIKLDQGLPLDNIGEDLKGVLKTEGYEVPVTTSNPFPIKFPLESLGFKNGIEIKLNLQMNSFNISGKNPEEVKNVTKELLSFLPKIKYESLSDIIKFYEIVATIGVKSNGSPMDSLNNSLAVNLEGLKGIDPDCSVIGVRLGSMKINLEEHDHVEISIEPKKGSSSERYLARFRYQSKDLNKIMDFDVEDKLLGIISSLKGE